MPVIDITQGVKIFHSQQQSALFGCPPEVIKFLMNQNLEFPEIIVLPDTNYRFGTLQNSTEFPLYYFLFMQGHLAQGKKLTIVGNHDQIMANRELLRLTLLGPGREEYAGLAESPYFEQLYRESQHLALKDNSGKIYSIDDLVNFVAFEDNQARFDRLVITRLGDDQYQVNDELVDIRFYTAQTPPYDLRNEFVPTMPSRFGITVLGGASGFIASKPCSGLVLNFNSKYMLIDCLPYLESSLNARGISKQEIHSVFLTHVHDDHCNLFPLLEFSRKIKLVTTREIFYMAIKKLSLQTMLPIETLQAAFEFVEIEAYKDYNFFGMTIHPHYTVHSIPTIGATFTMKEGLTDHTIVFVADNKSFTDIENMVRAGLVSDQKHQHLKHLYTSHFDIIFADGGSGILHGNPRDALASNADRIVFMHLESLDSEFDATFSIALPGKRYIISQGSYNSYLIKTYQILSDTFLDISADWATALMSNFRILTYNSGDIIVKQGEASKGMIYIILSGSCSVMAYDGNRLSEKARKEAGDFVGEMAVLDTNKIRNASIVARTPVTLCAIDEDLFYEFLVQENRVDELKNLWVTRAELKANFPFSIFSDHVIDHLSRTGKRLLVKAGESLQTAGQPAKYFYIILSGRFAVFHNGEKIRELGPGDIFGQYPGFNQKPQEGKIESLEEGMVLEYEQRQIKNLVDNIPVLNFYL